MGVTEVPLGCVRTSRPWPSMIASRPGRRGSAPAGLSAGRVVDAVLVDAPGRVVVPDGRVDVDDPPLRVVVVIEFALPVGVANCERVVVEGRADATQCACRLKTFAPFDHEEFHETHARFPVSSGTHKRRRHVSG